MIRVLSGNVAPVVATFFLLPLLAPAQITTGTVMGRVADSTGAVVPSAQVTLISEARGTRTAAVITSETGDYVIPNVAPDTYTLEVTAPSFKITRRAGIVVTGGDRVGVPPLTLEVGGTTETVNVTGEAALVQTQSGERSFAIESKQVDELPIVHGNFTSLVAFTPGVAAVPNTNNYGGGTRLGGQSQNNIMMDGISAMDTGNNGQMLNMNIESIGEVKVLTQGYQAEYGRSSGLQITAYTKSGTNELHGSGYGLFTNSHWNKNSWVNQMNGDRQPVTSQQIYGYSIGGPVVIPKVYNGRNKLFFFYAHEFRPSSIAINNGNPIRMRMPTAAERAGDFSQSRDNNGALLKPLMDYTTGAPFPGQQIPASRLYAPGVAVLSRYPLPNVTQLAGMNYNWQQSAPTYAQLLQQPAVKIDYQATGKLRLSGKYSGQRQRSVVTPGLIPGFSDAYVPYPYITNYGVTVDYMISPRTFIEGTYGQIENQLAGGNEQGILTDPESNRLTSLKDFPMLYPNAGVMNNQYYGYQVMQSQKPPFWDGKSLNLPPIFGWGSLIGGNCSLPSPACQRYPGWLNINRTRDVAISLTHIQGRHTIKGGFYFNHSYKAQNVGAGGIPNLSFQGFVDFGNNTNNTLDSGFGFANAGLGVFTQYLQASNFIEGNFLYNQVEFYLQDNWKVTNRLTLDYGARFVHQQPQYDKLLQMSNFFPNKWQAGSAPVFYVAGCTSGATVCSGNDRNAMDPRTGQILTAAGAANTQAAIGTPIPGAGNLLNGVVQAGHGIADTNYQWPALAVGPRFGFAYDLTGKSDWVLRGGVGVFYDRPDGNTVFSTPGNPPTATATDLRNGQLATLGQGLSPQPVANLVTFQYNAQIPSSLQWQVGVQKSLPGQMVADVMYVGNHGYNLLGAFQGGDLQNQNSVDFGAAYLPQNQDPTLGTSSVPGATAYTANLLRPYRGFGVIQENLTGFWDTYHSLQLSVNRRFAKGFSFGANYTYGISLKGNTGLIQRLQHAPDGTISLRSDQAAYEKLNQTLDVRPNYFIANAVWDIPGVTGRGAFVRQLTRDWQVSSVLTLASGAAYTPSYSYQKNGDNVNITGSPDWAGKMVLLNPSALGSGCSGNTYGEFNASDIAGPAYGSLGMESGRNYLRYCPTTQLDMSIARRIRIRERFRLEFRGDVWNATNAVQINAVNTAAQFGDPTSMTLVNNQYNAGGTLNPSRLTPRTAGFGAATGALPMRNIQLELRLQF